MKLRVAALVLFALVAAGRADAADRVIVALGDSLTAGLGVTADEAYPALLQARLTREGFPYRVVNAGVSGDTSAGGLRRLDWVLRSQPEIVIVALGANDGLRGQPVSALRANLVAIVDRIRASGARVLIAGMRMPPNYGAPYTRDFAAVYPDVARQTNSPLVPFLLEGVAADTRYNQGDGIHPNAAGHRLIAAHVWPFLRALLTWGARDGPPKPPALRGPAEPGRSATAVAAPRT